MHRTPIACAAATLVTLVAVAGTASGTVTEPNGLAVPIDSSPEIQLYTLFSQRGENINWITDAHTTPNVFSPLCGFSATYVLNQAGSHFGLSWYNDTGTQPAATDLHALVPANSAVGTMFNGTAIKNDPAYTGGVVGFALVGGETHYTNDAYDTVCTSCSPPGPWITALIYASTVTPDAYYVCFEDGPTSATGWDNDGDFNDDVYFVTGVTCQGGAQPCDTGLPGICAAGLTQCSAGGSGTTCQQLNQPAPTETCNGLDDNCNGAVDEGATCPDNKVCVMGSCVAKCGSEITCAQGLVCTTAGACVDPACVSVMCPSGEVCVAGACKAPCDGIVCPNPQVCRVGLCVDPCVGVTCPTAQVCDQGVCIPSCACSPCATGSACDTTSGQCVSPSCVGVACGAGTYCVGGTCVSDCKGAVCPSGQACMGSTCVDLPNGGIDAGQGLTGPGDSGSGSGSSSGGVGADGGLTGDAGDAGRGGSFGPTGNSGGCGCSSVGRDSGSNLTLGLIAGLGLAAAVGGRGRSRRRR
jgi:hypothetical protein